MNISKLTLGTAQLGQDYGIANVTGKPSKKVAFDILDTALKNGVNCIDTAPEYGTSEPIIGKYLKTHPTSCTLVTKLPLAWLHKKTDIDTLRMYMARSFSRLGMNPIAICLMRNAMELGKWYDKLLKLKRERFFGKLGVSVYTPEELEYSLSFDQVEAFQIPINLFDHRFIPYLPKLKGKIVFARSIFLQGLFFTDKPWSRKYVTKLKKVCNEFGTNIREASVTFVRDLPSVTSLVIGTTKPSSVLDNLDLIRSSPLSDNLRNYIYKEFADVPSEVIDPRRWNKWGKQ